MTNPYSPANNKKNNEFEEGIRRIRNKNNNFFENATTRNSIYDLKDIKSYFAVIHTLGVPDIHFRKNSELPERIEQDIRKLFYSIWPVEQPKEEQPKEEQPKEG